MIQDKVKVGPTFLVEDARSRRYRVTQYDWLTMVNSQWQPCWSVLMTENGGVLEAVGPNEYIVDGTRNLVRRL